MGVGDDMVDICFFEYDTQQIVEPKGDKSPSNDNESNYHQPTKFLLRLSALLTRMRRVLQRRCPRARVRPAIGCTWTACRASLCRSQLGMRVSSVSVRLCWTSMRTYSRPVLFKTTILIDADSTSSR